MPPIRTTGSDPVNLKFEGVLYPRKRRGYVKGPRDADCEFEPEELSKLVDSLPGTNVCVDHVVDRPVGVVTSAKQTHYDTVEVAATISASYPSGAAAIASVLAKERASLSLSHYYKYNASLGKTVKTVCEISLCVDPAREGSDLYDLFLCANVGKEGTADINKPNGEQRKVKASCSGVVSRMESAPESADGAPTTQNDAAMVDTDIAMAPAVVAEEASAAPTPAPEAMPSHALMGAAMAKAKAQIDEGNDRNVRLMAEHVEAMNVARAELAAEKESLNAERAKNDALAAADRKNKADQEQAATSAARQSFNELLVAMEQPPLPESASIAATADAQKKMADCARDAIKHQKQATNDANRKSETMKRSHANIKSAVANFGSGTNGHGVRVCASADNPENPNAEAKRDKHTIEDYRRWFEDEAAVGKLTVRTAGMAWNNYNQEKHREGLCQASAHTYTFKGPDHTYDPGLHIGNVYPELYALIAGSSCAVSENDHMLMKQRLIENTPRQQRYM